jgi:hypothetical protein
VAMNLKASIQKVVNKALEIANKIYDDVETSLFHTEETEKLIQQAAEKISATKGFKDSDVNEAILDLVAEKDSGVSVTGDKKKYVIDKRNSEVNLIARNILLKTKELRSKKKRSTMTPAETNILASNPFFLGGAKKRPKEDQNIVVLKEGIKTIRYENSEGKLLSMYDAKTLLGLFSLWDEQGRGEWFSFTEYELLERMNSLKSGGRQYKNVRESIETLRKSEIVIKEFYEKSKRMTIEETKSFNLIIARNVKETRQDGEVRSREYHFQFHDYIRKSFNDGYYGLISMSIYDELEKDTSKSLYLTLSALNNMSNNDRQEYLREEGYYEIPLSKIYSHLNLINEDRNNRLKVIESAEELKSLEILLDYQLVGEGRKADTIRFYPSKWFSELRSVDDKNTIEQVGALLPASNE